MNREGDVLTLLESLGIFWFTGIGIWLQIFFSDNIMQKTRIYSLCIYSGHIVEYTNICIKGAHKYRNKMWIKKKSG